MAAFKLNIADLVFVLKQIKIAEAHSTGTPLTQIWVDALGNVVPVGTLGATLAIPTPLNPLGLRTVDGSFNNLTAGRDTWGAADQPMPHLLPSYYRTEGDDAPFFGVSNNDYGVNRGEILPGGVISNGNVVDADPRLISNLIVDMSFNNPAAIVAALTYNGVEAIYGAGGALETIQAAFADLRAVLDNPPVVPPAGPLDPGYLAALAVYNQAATAANAAFDAALAPFGVEHNGASISIPNVAPDEGLSAPFNAWMTFFGQFFDHGLDLINKGGNGTVYVPLQADDPLMTHGADGIAGNADDLSRPENSNLRFMALTRATPSGDTEVNQTTPFVDQNQTYTSNASHQVFLREYKLVDPDGVGGPLGLRPLATGHLLDGSEANETVSSLPTWADVKAQALTVLGIRLTDLDVGNIPVLLVDQYGEFVRGPAGLPYVLAGFRVTAGGDVPIYVQGNIGAPINPSAIPLQAGMSYFNGTTTTTLAVGDVIRTGSTTNPLDNGTEVITVSAARTGHAFMDDIAHNAAPVVNAGVLQQDADTIAAPNGGVGNAVAVNAQGRNTEYDNELLDQHFITGDGRGNENIGLTTVHHIFHSEHNRQVEQQKLTVLASGDLAFINEWLLVDITQAELDAFAGLPAANLPAPPGPPGPPNDLTDVANTLSWDGERLFQAARFATEMQYQHLVFEEFARKIQPNIDVFVFNTNPDINPAIFAEFAHVVYRFGHSMLTDNMPRLDANGNPMAAMAPDGSPLTADEFGLVASFLNPVSFDNNGAITDDQGAAAIIRGMTIERGNEIDEFIVDALRNNLLGLPLDLAAINIARGRDTGMPSLNQARQALYDASGSTFLEPYDHWVDFAANLKNPVSVVNFIAAYGTHTSITSATTSDAKRDAAWLLVMGGTGAPADRMQFLTNTGAWAPSVTNSNKGGLNEIDLWIGGLAEKKMPFGGFLGSTFNAVFELQMENLQDGDRFYYLTRTQGQNFLVSLEQNSFAKMIMANTDLAQPGDDGIRGTADDIIARHMGVDSFAVYDHVLEVNAANQQDYTPESAADLAAANAAVTAAQTAYNAAQAAAATDAAALQVIADSTDASLELAQVITLAGTSGVTVEALQLAVTEYGVAVAADQAAADAFAADANEAAALAALNASIADRALVIAGGSRDPIGNNPVLEAVGLGKVIRVDLSGVVQSNYIRVQGGEHTAVGGTAGNDTIITDFGDDGIWGDAGDDRIESGAGVDLVNGGSGNDVITDSGDTGDFLKGDEGDDVITGGNGLDIYMGGEGKDVIFMSLDASETFAGQGNDFVLGGDDADVIMGNEGDDWIEGGAGFDGIDGDMSELFFDSRIIGHDVLFSGSEEQDFEGESGDDIMVQGESVIRNGGQMGFDWVTYKGNPNAADVDLARPIFTTVAQDILRNRFDQVEAASGYNANDLLVGDDRIYDVNATAIANVDGAPGTVFYRDDIDQTGIDRIAGLSQVITTAQMTAGRAHTAEFADLNPGAPLELVFGDGNVLIGGGGSDVLIGKGGNDILDGDRWLNVRIRITQAGQGNTAANQIATIDSLDHVFTALTAGANTAWIGKSLSQLLIDRTIVPNQMHIVREILNGNVTGDVDTAVFWDVRGNYTFTSLGDGTFRVEHTTVGNPAVLPPGFVKPVSDGVDTLRNIEMLRFGNGLGGIQTFTLREIFNRAPTGNVVIDGQPAREGSTLNALLGIQDANGINLATQTIQWQSSVDGLSWSNIAGATGTSFTPPALPGIQVSPFAANLFRVVVSYTDNAGFAEVVISPPTGPMGIVWSAAGLGVQTFTGFAGPDSITGSDFADTLNGGAGDDLVVGGGGADALLGGAGNDRLLGGNGDDTLTGGDGNDIIDGQAGGLDAAVFAGPVASYRYTTQGAAPVLTDTVGNGGTDTVSNVEILRIAGADYTIRMGTNGEDTFAGQDGSQIVFGRNNEDVLAGGNGNDIIIGGGGDDTINGGNGNDYIVYHAGTDGRDIITGGPDNEGIDTFVLHGAVGGETFRIYTRAAFLAQNPAAGLAAGTEIVITRNGTTNASVIAELNNIEEIVINSTDTTANDGGGLNQSDTTGDTILVFGNFASPNTSLDYSTITINGSSANDTVDITGLQSDHRIVFTTNGGADTVLGSVRTQDTINGAVNDLRTTGSVTGATTFGAQDGLNAMVGGSVQNALLGGSAGGEVSRGRTMVETDGDLVPLDSIDAGPVAPMFIEHVVHVDQFDHRSIAVSILTDYPVS